MGTLDMGGASTEITFLHSSNHQSDDPYQTTITLFDNAHDLYARSYLCYGLNQARLRLLAHLYNVSGSILLHCTYVYTMYVYSVLVLL